MKSSYIQTYTILDTLILSRIRGMRDLKTGLGFHDRIYWTFIQLVTTVHKSLTDTLSSSSGSTGLDYHSLRLLVQKSKVEVPLRLAVDRQ
jgi:hypothetical protein